MDANQATGERQHCRNCFGTPDAQRTSSFPQSPLLPLLPVSPYDSLSGATCTPRLVGRHGDVGAPRADTSTLDEGLLHSWPPSKASCRLWKTTSAMASSMPENESLLDLLDWDDPPPDDRDLGDGGRLCMPLCGSWPRGPIGSWLPERLPDFILPPLGLPVLDPSIARKVAENF